MKIVKNFLSSSELAAAVSLDDFEVLARRYMPRQIYDYVASGVADELTMRWNRLAFEQITLLPRALTGIRKVNLNRHLFGHNMSMPIILAPAAFQELLHLHGECETARAAQLMNVPFIVSQLTNNCLAEISKQAPGQLWFQFYDIGQKREDFVKKVIKEAEELGIRAFCVTVDAPTLGLRNRLERSGFKLPPGLKLPYVPYSKTLEMSAGLPTFKGNVWKDVARLRRLTKLPIVLKGVLNCSDVKRAIASGINGIVVSNHGGRVLDTVPATIDMLPEIIECVSGKVPVLLDGGVRRGTDILKALALGAEAVLLGRPYLYGLALAGSRGVQRVLQITRRELETAMLHVGCASVSQIRSEIVRRRFGGGHP